jgi:photosystem II stability/assembly factor-like uncharacterized protein
VAAAGVVVVCAVGTVAQGAEEIAESPLIVHQIAPDPGDPNRFYAITSNMGVLATHDGGRRWSHANRGLRSFTHHALIAVMAPGSERPMLLAGGWGGGVSVSADRAATWTERNGDLANTAIDALAIDPADAARWYAATSTSIFRSTDGGSHWEPFGQGLPALSEAVGYKSLAIEPQPNGRIWLGTEGGLFFRDRDGDRWVSDPDLGSARVTVVACDPRDRRIYVGTIKQGVYVGTAGAWRRVGDAGWFVSRIVVHPREASRVYLATRGAGVFASDDEGATWTPLGKGLSDADVRSLAVHPANPARLAVGTTSSGIFYSHDGGASWHAASRVARLTMSQIVAMLTPAAPRGDARPIPPAFAKCSRCHGWTDERLNEKHTYWRVPPNPRNWAPAVDRMAARAELTDAERTDITRFLTVYSGAAAP